MPPKCSNYKRPKRGHEGPVDQECVLDEVGEGAGAGKYQIPSDQIESEDEDIDPHVTPNPDNPGAIHKIKKSPSPRKHKSKVDSTGLAFKEILHQMGNLTCSVQRLVDGQQTLTLTQEAQKRDIEVLKSTKIVQLQPCLCTMTCQPCRLCLVCPLCQPHHTHLVYLNNIPCLLTMHVRPKRP